MRHPHDTCALTEFTVDFPAAKDVRLRMLRDRILVKLDKTKEKSAGGIHIPQAAMDNVLQTGTILAFGWRLNKDGTSAPIPDLAVGQKVVFLRFIKDHHSNMLVRERYGKSFTLLQTSDILLVFDAEDAEKFDI